MTPQDMADVINGLNISAEQFESMMRLFMAQVEVARARGAVQVATAQQAQVEAAAREDVAAAQNELEAAESALAALVAAAAG